MSTNERIKQLQDEIKSLEEVGKKEMEAQRKIDEAAWHELVKDKTIWEWAIKPTERQPWMDKSEPTKYGVTVNRRVKPEIIEAFRSAHPLYAIDERWYVNWNGMFYYRTPENILYHDGGGCQIIRDVTIVNDEEWAEILSGNIPTRLIK